MRDRVIQQLIQKYNYQSYLEIGLNKGETIRKIKCTRKVGVDPKKPAITRGYIYHQLTSDEFFTVNQERFDIIFIDGLHHADQVYRDILNALDCCNGTIVCHDMSPKTKEVQEIPRTGVIWTGDCWKAWVRLRQERDDLEMYVLDTDYGCGVIQRGSQTLLPKDLDLTFENLEANRQEWLNLRKFK